ncbi:MAG TPA: hypothetical protein VFQ89_12895 [Candidatus Binatia bacterium]|nr:hypothetical protein [Candidatus Binatia bacterium]
MKTGRLLGLTMTRPLRHSRYPPRGEGEAPPDTSFGIRGSAVTGNGFEKTTKGCTKNFFDVGRQSDHDMVSKRFIDRSNLRRLHCWEMIF